MKLTGLVFKSENFNTPCNAMPNQHTGGIDYVCLGPASSAIIPAVHVEVVSQQSNVLLSPYASSAMQRYYTAHFGWNHPCITH